jgi:hypothetical protein
LREPGKNLFQKALPPSLFAERWRTTGNACRMPVRAGLVAIRPTHSRQSIYQLTLARYMGTRSDGLPSICYPNG